MTSSDPTAGLPPKPDARTGEPRPAHAPGVLVKAGMRRVERDRERSERAKPSPPPDQGPVLAWYRSSWWSAIRLGVGAIIILIIGVALLSLSKGHGLNMLGWWFTWVIILLGALGITASTKKDWCAAGSDWLLHQKAWVRTYELTEIKTRGASNSIYLMLTDSEGRKIDADLSLLQTDRLVWDLLYNGMRHSVAKGARLKGTARSAIGLQTIAQPQVPKQDF